jgi:hypothetical protein
LILASASRQFAIAEALGPLTRTRDDFFELWPAAILNGVTTDLAAFGLFVGPWLILGRLLEGRERARFWLGEAASRAVLAVLAVLLCLDVVALGHTGSRLNFALLEILEDARAFLGLLSTGAGLLPVIGGLIAAASAPTLLAYALARLERGRLPRRYRVAVGIVLILACVDAFRIHVAAGFADLGFQSVLLIEEYEDPAVGLVLQAVEPERGSLAIPTVLSSEDRRRIREEFLEDESPPLSADYPLFRRFRQRGPRVLPVRDAPSPKNVVLIMLEGNSAEDVGALGDGQGLTPRFDTLAKDGLLFTNFFSTTTATTQSFFATLFSLFPPQGGLKGRLDHVSGRGTLLRILADRGFATAFLLSPRDRELDLESLSQVVRHFQELVKIDEPRTQAWGDDRAVLGLAASFLESARQPFFLALSTETHHLPWNVPGERFRDIEVRGTYAESCATLRYQDAALGEFFDRVRNLPSFEDTLFVLVGDHGRRLSREGAPRFGDFDEEALHVPCLLYCPRVLPGARSDLVGSHVDLAPTILDLLGIDDVEATMAGRSLLRGGQGRAYAHMRYGHPRFVLIRDGIKADYDAYYDRTTCYRLGTDTPIDVSPAERQSLANEMFGLNRYATWVVANGRLTPPDEPR